MVRTLTLNSKASSDMRESMGDSLLAALNLPVGERPIIAAVGGGGKTTTLSHLQRMFLTDGKKSVIMTTTHIQDIKASYSVYGESERELSEILQREGRVWLGRPFKEGKIGAVSDAFYRFLLSLEVPLLIEADGAKRLPVKTPEAHEPVIPEETTCVLAVYGLDCLDKAIETIACRPERVASIMGKTVESVISEEDIVTLALSRNGGRKGIGPNMRYQVILNKADDDRLTMRARRIAAYLVRQGVEAVHITDHLRI